MWDLTKFQHSSMHRPRGNEFKLGRHRVLSRKLILKSPFFLGLAGDYGTLASSRAHEGRPKKGGLRNNFQHRHWNDMKMVRRFKSYICFDSLCVHVLAE